VFMTQTSSASLTNCILWGNTPGQVGTEPAATATVSYSDIQGGWPGTANMNADPLFTTTPCPYSLQPGSQCINAGSTAAVPAGISTDLCSNPRFVGVVDMGASEFQGATCYANCDSSTTPPVLNVLDFSCFLNRFAAGDTYANCDGSTQPPALNVQDFSCFLNAFAAGCS